MTEAVKMNAQQQSILKLSLKKLDQMIDEYSQFYNKTIFEENDFIKAQPIIKEELVFEYPTFINTQAVLTKNRKNIQIYKKKTDKHTIQTEYGLMLKDQSLKVNSVAISGDDQLVVSGLSDFTVRVWNLPEKKQEMIFKGHKAK